MAVSHGGAVRRLSQLRLVMKQGHVGIYWVGGGDQAAKGEVLLQGVTSSHLLAGAGKTRTPGSISGGGMCMPRPWWCLSALRDSLLPVFIPHYEQAFYSELLLSSLTGV